MDFDSYRGNYIDGFRLNVRMTKRREIEFYRFIKESQREKVSRESQGEIKNGPDYNGLHSTRILKNTLIFMIIRDHCRAGG